VMISMFNPMVLLLRIPSPCRICAENGFEYNMFSPLP
jgi:hypothetical protein